VFKRQKPENDQILGEMPQCDHSRPIIKAEVSQVIVAADCGGPDQDEVF